MRKISLAAEVYLKYTRKVAATAAVFERKSAAPNPARLNRLLALLGLAGGTAAVAGSRAPGSVGNYWADQINGAGQEDISRYQASAPVQAPIQAPVQAMEPTASDFEVPEEQPDPFVINDDSEYGYSMEDLMREAEEPEQRRPEISVPEVSGIGSSSGIMGSPAIDAIKQNELNKAKAAFDRAMEQAYTAFEGDVPENVIYDLSSKYATQAEDIEKGYVRRKKPATDNRGIAERTGIFGGRVGDYYDDAMRNAPEIK